MANHKITGCSFCGQPVGKPKRLEPVVVNGKTHNYTMKVCPCGKGNEVSKDVLPCPFPYGFYPYGA